MTTVQLYRPMPFGGWDYGMEWSRATLTTEDVKYLYDTFGVENVEYFSQSDTWGVYAYSRRDEITKYLDELFRVRGPLPLTEKERTDRISVDELFKDPRYQEIWSDTEPSQGKVWCMTEESQGKIKKRVTDP